MPVVTIARQFGCGGSEVGRAVADALGAQYVDRWLIVEAARRTGVPEDILSERDERVRPFTERLLSEVGLVFTGRHSTAPRGPRTNYPPSDAQLLAVTRSLIREVARGGNAVIVGRGAQVILQDASDTLHVHLVAPLSARVQYVVDHHGVSLDDARELLIQEDAHRVDYMRTFYGVDRDDPTLYDLVINTARLNQTGVVQMIVMRAAMLEGGERLSGVDAEDENAQRLLNSLRTMRESLHAIVERHGRHS